MTKIPHLFAIAAVAALGLTACEDKKATTPDTKKEEPTTETPKTAQPSAPKPTKPVPSTDEVINSPPDAAPAPPPPKPPAAK